MAAEISTDEAGAADRSAAGVDVVLLLAEGVPYGLGRGAPGRVAVFVTGGDTPSELDLASAATMAAELFGAPLRLAGARPPQ